MGGLRARQNLSRLGLKTVTMPRSTTILIFAKVFVYNEMTRKALGLLATFGFVAGVLGVAYLVEKRRRKISLNSCPTDEKVVDEWLSKLSELYNTRKPRYTMRAEEVCPDPYVACITYPEPLHFTCGRVKPRIVAHEFGHWLLKQKESPYYADEEVVEGFAQISLKLLSKPKSSLSLRRVSCLPSPVCWPGGKRLLTKELQKRIPSHRVYVEPFAGAAWLFFEKQPAEVNVINDIDSELMGFYRKLRDTDEIVCDMKPDREKFERIKAKKNKTVCEFLYQNKNSFGCRMDSFTATKRSQTDCVKKGYPPNCTIQRVVKLLPKYKERLKNAIIENADFREIIQKYDSPDTFFYLDPPYVGPNQKGCLYQGMGGCNVSPEEVYESVKNMKGKFLLSYDNHPKIRKIFENGDFIVEEVEMPYSFEQRPKGGKGRRKTELLIRNYN